MALMFSATPSVKRAVSLINDIDSAKFPLLLSRILQKLHSKDETAFSEEEEERLQSAFKLESKDLTLVLESSEFFMQQAAYHSAKPAVLAKQLQQLELEEDKVQAFTDVWVTLGKEVIEKLRQRSMAPKQLDDVNWRLHLQLAQASQAKLKTPVAVFEFNVKDEAKSENEKIHVEFDHQELYDFYNKLEAIQSQLDSLS